MKSINKFPKKLWSVLLVFVVSTLITACGVTKQTESNSPTGSSSSENTVAQINFPEKGKPVQFIIPVKAGGGFDAIGRNLAKAWEPFLGTNIVVQNISGAEYNNAVFAMLKAKPDGYQVIFTPALLNQVLGKVDYDINEFEWIGRVSTSTLLTVASKKSGMKSFDDFKKKGKSTVAVTSMTSPQTVGSLLVAREAGMQPSTVSHEGSSEALLSVIRGDTDWVNSNAATLLPAVQGGDVVPLFLAGNRLKELPETPTLAELGYPQLDKQLRYDRFIATNPGTPPEVVKILRDTFKKAVEDPDFVKSTNQIGESTAYLSGEDSAALVKELLELVKPNVDYLKSFK